jgi:adenosylhomocysteinase
MDMSFAIQALSARYLADNRGQISEKLFPVPKEIDREVAQRLLSYKGLTIDKLTKEQEVYLYGGTV